MTDTPPEEGENLHRPAFGPAPPSGGAPGPTTSEPARAAHTSERVTLAHYRSRPDLYLIYLFHFVAYAWFSRECGDRDVLDFGSGSGHGTLQVAEVARSVVGADVDAESVAASETDFGRQGNISFRKIDPVEKEPLPFKSESFDVVISNQVIEHVPDPGLYLSEAWRVLRPGGILFVATPDRTHRLGPSQKPWNRFHRHEFSPVELADLVSRTFTNVSLHAMDGRPDLIQRETRRVRALARLTRPFTFPRAPEVWRQAGLRGLKGLNRLRDRARAGRNAEIDFGESDIWIANDADWSPNIVLRAERAAHR